MICPCASARHPAHHDGALPAAVFQHKTSTSLAHPSLYTIHLSSTETRALTSKHSWGEERTTADTISAPPSPSAPSSSA